MAFLIDFGAIKSGGGAQLAFNFLKQLDEKDIDVSDVCLLLPSEGPLSKEKFGNKYASIIYSPSNYFKRIIFENITLYRFIRKMNIKKIYTFFGSGLPHPVYVQSIVSVAYPIICYPDSPYWKYLALIPKYKKLLINNFRRARLRKASHIIAETEVMKARLSREIPYDIDNISVIPPAPSGFLQDIDYDFSTTRNTYLFLSGTDPHKNIWRLYAVAEELERKGFLDFTFIITVNKDNYMASLNESNIDESIIDKHFKFLGTVHPSEIQTVYQQSDFLVLLTDLESFSNNYMESWKAGVPMIVSDRDFARHICQDSAIYVEPHDINDVCEKIISVSGDSDIKRNLVESGKRRLSTLKSTEERFDEIWVNIIKAD